MSPHPGHATLRALRSGDIVDLDGSGVLVRIVPGDLAPGDDYVGARNTVNLLTVDRIVSEDNWVGGYVIPVETAYPFDLTECVKVEIVDC